MKSIWLPRTMECDNAIKIATKWVWRQLAQNIDNNNRVRNKSKRVTVLIFEPTVDLRRSLLWRNITDQTNCPFVIHGNELESTANAKDGASYSMLLTLSLDQILQACSDTLAWSFWPQPSCAHIPQFYNLTSLSKQTRCHLQTLGKSNYKIEQYISIQC